MVVRPRGKYANDAMSVVRCVISQLIDQKKIYPIGYDSLKMFAGKQRPIGRETDKQILGRPTDSGKS